MTAPRTIELVVLGIPRTKKNSSRLVGRDLGNPRILPSKAWTRWCKTATFWSWVKFEPHPHGTAFRPTRYDGAVNCRALFYRDANRGDAVGFYQGLADLLEKRRIIVNDSQIRSWDGSRLLKDAAHPRVEIELTELEPQP